MADGLEGHAGHVLAFTTGRGNDMHSPAIAVPAPHAVGLIVE